MLEDVESTELKGVVLQIRLPIRVRLSVRLDGSGRVHSLD